LALLVVAEGSWITVLADLVQDYALRAPLLGIPAFTAFVAGGTLAGATLGRRLGGRWPPIALLLVIAAGVLGCLTSPEARAALVHGDVGRAVASHPGGWLAGLAVVRGFAHAGVGAGASAPESLIRLGLPGVALAVGLGGAIAEPWRSAFHAGAIVAAAAFAVTATLGLAFTRLTVAGHDAGFDWRRGPAGGGLVALAVLSVIVGVVAFGDVIGGGIQLVLASAIGPLLVVGLMFGWSRVELRVVVSLALVVLAVGLVTWLIGGLGGSSEPSIQETVDQLTARSGPSADRFVGIGLGAAGVLGASALIVVLVRRWMRRLSVADTDSVTETRWIDFGTSSRPARRGLRLRRPAPRDAATAYAALMDDLEPRDAVRRMPAETPFEHATRLRAMADGRLSLDLLAADYALARFGDVSLSKAETRRAIGRWHELRRTLGRRVARPAPAPPTADTR
jgi:multisubunit Na+/H+ antiporter MnhC subunit